VPAVFSGDNAMQTEGTVVNASERAKLCGAVIEASQRKQRNVLRRTQSKRQWRNQQGVHTNAANPRASAITHSPTRCQPHAYV